MKQCCECNHLIMKCCVNLWIFPLKFILSQNPSTCLNVALIINATIVKILSPPPLVILSTRYHGSSVVDFDSVRGGISLETEKNEAGTTSRLLLTRATLRDSGNYTCVPSGAISSSVQVHVLNGASPCVPTLPEGLIKFILFFERHQLQVNIQLRCKPAVVHRWRPAAARRDICCWCYCWHCTAVTSVN